jgi:hypothetical protein
VALPASKEAKPFEVLPENWEAVQTFMRCQTQWRTSMAGLIGLDYGAVQWLLRLYEVEDHRSALEDLQIMEAAVLSVVAKRGK